MTRPLTPAPTKADFVIKPPLVAKRLLYMVFILLILNVCSLYVRYVLHWEGLIAGPFFRLFNLNTESNIPTFFSALLLLSASVLLMVIAKQTLERKTAHRWWLLSGVFLFLAADEATLIHEAVTPILDVFRTSNTGIEGYFRYIWIIPYTMLFIALALYCMPFLWQLPVHIRNLFVLSGCIFVTGAAGLEAAEGHYDTVYGYNSVYKIILYTIEEVMEMGGVILFIYALLLYISANTKEIRLGIYHKQNSLARNSLGTSMLSGPWSIPAKNATYFSAKKQSKLPSIAGKQTEEFS